METMYVTVGTTKFDALIKEITKDAVLKVLQKRGCRRLVIQYGQGQAVDAHRIKEQYDIDVIQYDFKFEPVRSDIKQADLVVGHAGAGTCMDILQHQKRALIVVNQELMDNHQTELATQLAEDGYVYYCEVSRLAHNLENLNFGALKPYVSKAENMQRFVNYLNDQMA